MGKEIENVIAQESEIIENGVHNFTDPSEYVVPQDELVRENVKKFMGYKLGFMMHWAPGSQLGMMESWPLCDAESEWSQTEIDWTDDVEEFKDAYNNANKTFNPVKFRPDQWAEFAKECGFKYLLFTTKHHDGFCMYDTKTTDYKITDPSCPFSKNKYADIVGNLYEEFRKQGLAISVYFSKPDWHSDDYWAKDFGAPADRNVNYDVKQYPERWEKFVKYTHEQLTELTTNYGKVDALWLDGGWVRPDNKGQDIRLGEISEKIRATTQPGLIVCDRTVGGEYENILTPEQTVPTEPLTVPWESCVTAGHAFSFHYDDVFKSPCELVHLLIDVVSKGGNLALNIPAQPDGKLPYAGMQSLRGMGRWLDVNGEGIYDTVICPELKATEKTAFTKTDKAIYMFYIYEENAPKLQKYMILPIKQKIEQIILLRTGKTLQFTQDDKNVRLSFEGVNMKDAQHSDCVKFIFA